jgi:hypothetical protein
MLARLQRGNRLRRMIRDRRVDVDGVDVRILQQVLVARVAGGDAEAVAARVELFLVPPADRVHLGIGVTLIDRDELGAEAESDERDANLFVSHTN